MTTVLEQPANLLGLVGQSLGTTEWIEVTQQQVDLFADATGDRQWIHTDAERAAKGPYKGTIAHGYLTLSLTPAVIAQVLEIREQKTSGVESVFTLTYEIDGEDRPACVADVIVLFP